MFIRILEKTANIDLLLILLNSKSIKISHISLFIFKTVPILTFGNNNLKINHLVFPEHCNFKNICYMQLITGNFLCFCISLYTKIKNTTLKLLRTSL